MRIALLIIIYLGLSLNTYAQNWQSLNSGCDNYPRCLYSDTIDNLLYVSGHFKYADNVLVNGVASWNGSSWDSVGSGINTCTNDCFVYWDLFRYHGYLYSAGYPRILLPQATDPGSFISRWNGTEWESMDGDQFYECHADCMFEFNDQLLVGGCFDTIAGVEAHQLAVWNDTSWSAFDTTDFDYIICDMIEYKNELYVGGNFDTQSGLHEIARWNGTNWAPVGNGIYGDAIVNCFAIYHDELYAGGYFNTSTGNISNNIQSWDGNNWHGVGGGIGNGSVMDMAVYNDELWVVGQFTMAGNIDAQYVAKWDGIKWCGMGNVFSNVVGQICVYNNELYIGGGFQTIDGDTMNYIAKWVGGNYVDTCSTVGINEVLNEKENLQIYPNPAHTALTFNINKLNLQTSKSETTFIIIDNLGIEVKTGVTNSFLHTVSVEELREGMYIIILKNDKLNEKRKFVKLNE